MLDCTKHTRNQLSTRIRDCQQIQPLIVVTSPTLVNPGHMRKAKYHIVALPSLDFSPVVQCSNDRRGDEAVKDDFVCRQTIHHVHSHQSHLSCASRSSPTKKASVPLQAASHRPIFPSRLGELHHQILYPASLPIHLSS